METFYITTAIDYVNGEPHIGHAYEKIMADTIARHHRQRQKEVFFLTGTDEHGTKIQKSAQKENLSPKEYTDKISQCFINAWERLDVSYDKFIRTSDQDHYDVVKDVFTKLVAKGDIYKAAYTGLYCNGCEKFLTQRDLVDGKCLDHNETPTEVIEENYFFKLTKYKNKLIEHIKAHPEFIQPDFRRNEVLNQLEDTEDISVSRDKKSVSWGIPVPGDEDQTVYVWIDALSNYITGVGYLKDEEHYNKFWPADIHLIGKDIIKFHGIFWSSMLMALELPLPKSLIVHGFITVNESKISKTIQNVVDPLALSEKYNLDNNDAIRYYLLSNSYLGKDMNFSEDDFLNKVDADLANNLGNLLNRTLTMLVKYNDGVVTQSTGENELSIACSETKEKVLNAFDKSEIGLAAEAIIRLVDQANKYINAQEPWAKFKDPERQQECLDDLYNVLETIRWATVMIQPLIPNIASKMFEQLCLDPAEYNNYDQLVWGKLNSSIKIEKAKIKPVFLRIGSQLAGDKKKK